MIRLLVRERIGDRERVVEYHDVTHRRAEERERLREVLELAYGPPAYRVEQEES